MRTNTRQRSILSFLCTKATLIRKIKKLNIVGRCLRVLAALFLIVNVANCQYEPIVPPSPQIEQLQKYIDYPVDHTTGIPDISLPLYQINTGSIKFPITISYHSSGFKPEEENGDLGLSWSLNAAIPISRIIKNKPDENSIYPVYADPESLDQEIQSDFNYIGNLDGRNGQVITGMDAEYDMFYYDIGSSRGNFIFAAADNNGSGKRKPIIIPYEPNLISTNKGDFSNPNTPLEYIEITDKLGNIYRYGRSSIDNSVTIEESDPINHLKTAWFLKEIFSSDRSHYIKFKYLPVVRSRISQSDAFEFTDKKKLYKITTQNEGIMNALDNKQKLILGEIHNKTYNSYRLSEITFREGKIEISYSNLGIQKICIKNSFDSTIRNIIFEIKPFETTISNAAETQTGLLKLSSVKFFGKDSLSPSVYRLVYNEPANIALAGGALRSTKGIDYWGYFNGKVNNSSLVPSFTMPDVFPGPIISSSNDKEANEDQTKLFMLKKIYYPTGGYSEFEYESNKVDDKTVGGLRIRSILNKPYFNSPETVKLYSYGTQENGNGILMFNPYDIHSYLTLSEQNVLDPEDPTYIIGTLRNQSVSSSPSYGGNNCPVFYSEVSEYRDSKNGEVSGKSVYEYEPPSTNNIGLIGGSYYEVKFNKWETGHLKTKTDFKKVGSSFVPSNKEQYLYAFSRDSIIKCSIVQLKQIINNDGLNSLWSYFKPYPGSNRDFRIFSRFSDNSSASTIAYQNSKGVIFNIVEHDIYVGAKLLKRKTSTAYTETGQITNSEDYSYGNYHNDPISISRPLSGGDTLKTVLKYPHDYGSQPYIDMVVAKHIWTPVVEKIDYRISEDGVEKFIKSIKHNFEFWGDSKWATTPTNRIYLQSIDEKILSNPSRHLVQYNKYDNWGNVLERNKANGEKEIYLWGYNNSYPVAKIIGADYNSVINKVSQEQLDSVGNNELNIRNLLESLRTIPNTQVYTYTYKPLIGLSSETDPKMMSQYYDYDRLGRLNVVKDGMRNLLKRIDYNTSGENLDTNIVYTPPHVYYNSALSKVFTRNNCGAGYIGGTILYKVLENSYTSTLSQIDADNKARQDLETHGQNYANANATCTYAGGISISLINNINLPSTNPVKVQFIKLDNDLGTDVIYAEAAFPSTSMATPEIVIIPPGNYKLRFTFTQSYNIPYGPGFLLGNDSNPNLNEWYDGYNPNGFEYITNAYIQINTATTRLEAINTAH